MKARCWSEAKERTATIAVLVENEAGVLARVIGLFSGRGYNIESLTVAPVDETRRISRITVVTTGTEMTIEQIKAQLDRLVPVHKVSDLTLDGAHLQRELALVKVVGRGEPIQLDYRMEKGQAGWRIYDLNVLGFWLVETYRAQFAQEITANGIDGLISALAERNKAGSAPAKKS